MTKTSTLLFGADLIFRKIGWGNYMIFDEFEVQKVVDKELIKNGGIIEEYTFLGSNPPNLLAAPGFERVKEVVHSSGMSM